MPQKTSSFNDDVPIEAYIPAHLANSRRRRRGIHEPLDGFGHFDEHVRRALRARSPLRPLLLFRLKLGAQEAALRARHAGR